MKQPIRNCLLEAKRRYETFHADEDILKAWTGLGYPSEYKVALSEGYMIPVSSNTPKVLNWYRLTEKGAKAIREEL
jgi:hypothetical protein